MDTFAIKKMIIDMMRSYDMSLLQAEIKAKDIVSVACDLIREDYENGYLQ